MPPKPTICRRALVIALSAAALTGCGALKPDPALTQRAEEAYVMLATARYEDLYKQFTPQHQNNELLALMPQMREIVPPGRAAGPPTLNGWEFSNGADGAKRIVTFTYSYPDVPAFVVVKTQFVGSDKDGWKIEGMDLDGRRGSPVESVSLGRGKITPPPKLDQSAEAAGV